MFRTMYQALFRPRVETVLRPVTHLSSKTPLSLTIWQSTPFTQRLAHDLTTTGVRSSGQTGQSSLSSISSLSRLSR